MGKLQKKGAGKLVGPHTSFTPLALKACKQLSTCDLVTKISCGYMKGGLKPPKGNRSIKATESERGAALILLVRDNLSKQTIHIFGSNSKGISKELEKICQDLKIDFFEA